MSFFADGIVFSVKKLNNIGKFIFFWRFFINGKKGKELKAKKINAFFNEKRLYLPTLKAFFL